jgi:hypothetical protein
MAAAAAAPRLRPTAALCGTAQTTRATSAPPLPHAGCQTSHPASYQWHDCLCNTTLLYCNKVCCSTRAVPLLGYDAGANRRATGPGENTANCDASRPFITCSSLSCQCNVQGLPQPGRWRDCWGSRLRRRLRRRRWLWWRRFCRWRRAHWRMLQVPPTRPLGERV